MALFSPSKNDRIQRHLMRQRGAGARDIAVDFGFAFAFVSSNSNSSQPEPAVPEPPAKRRKVYGPSNAIENADKSDREAVNAIVVEKDIEEKKITKKVAKSRRRPKDELDDVRATSPRDKTGEDSFIYSVNSKKPKGKCKVGEHVEVGKTATVEEKEKAPQKSTKRARKPKSNPEIKAIKSGEMQPEPDVSVRRPRRKAAVDAAAKVADDFVEEAMPIDKKRRNPVPASRPRNRGDIGVLDMEKLQTTVEMKCRPSLEPGQSVCRITESVANELSETSAGIPVKMKTSKAPSKRKTAKSAECHVEDLSRSSGNTESEVTQSKTSAVPNATVPCKPPSKIKPKTTELVIAEEQAEIKTCQSQTVRRRPLQETDVNTSLRMLSPQKAHTAKTKAVISGLISKDQMTKAKMSSVTKGSKSKTISKPSISALKKSPKRKTCEADDDIDWILTSQPSIRSAPRITKLSSTTIRSKTSKMVDIDLDDLVSNIASYAKELQGVPAPKTVSRKRKL